MPDINFDKLKVSPLNIDTIDMSIAWAPSWKDLSDRHHEWTLHQRRDRLHVNQSTVSTRIHTLEDQLGCTLCPGQGWHNTHVNRSAISETCRHTHSNDKTGSHIGILEGLSCGKLLLK
jgi:hypothetical protein